MNVRTVLGNDVTMFTRDGTTDRMVIDAIMRYDEYKIAKYKHEYKNGDIFIDIGAHVGAVAVMLAKHNPTFQVFAFEALPENYKQIMKNVTVNQLKNIKVFNFAVTDKSEGKFPIYHTGDKTKFEKEHRYIGSSMGAGDNKIMVNQVSLNDLLSDGFPHVKMLKIDAEGGECLGFPHVSKENLNKIDFIVGEFHGLGMNYGEFWSLFEPYFVDFSADINRKAYLCDFLFINKNFIRKMRV